MNKPFRWNIEKRNELGSLINGKPEEIEKEFISELIDSTSRIIAFSNNSELFFIGRSPENYFDFLNGIYSKNNEIKKRINLFQFSGRFFEPNELKKFDSPQFFELRKQMIEIGLSPNTILKRNRNTALIDLIYSGSTIRNLVTIIKNWALNEKADWNGIKSKIRIVGITSRTKNSPNTWRWQQQKESIETLDGIKVKNVSVNWWFWHELGDEQSKVTLPNSASKWINETNTKPEITKERIEGLNFAFYLNNLGKQSNIKEELRASLQKQIEMKNKWFKEWITEI